MRFGALRRVHMHGAVPSAYRDALSGRNAVSRDASSTERSGIFDTGRRMNKDLLQQLRDIHLPVEPGWWPPAIGWWLLALMLAAAVAWLAWRLAARWRRFRPARTARALYREISRQLDTGAITPAQYVPVSYTHLTLPTKRIV